MLLVSSFQALPLFFSLFTRMNFMCQNINSCTRKSEKRRGIAWERGCISGLLFLLSLIGVLLDTAIPILMRFAILTLGMQGFW